MEEIATDSRSQTIVCVIIARACARGLSVIAEMAETEAQVLNLAGQGCDQVQGFYFSRPLPSQDCEKLLRERLFTLPESAQFKNSHAS